MYRKYGKRFTDVVLSSLLILLCLPIMLLAALFLTIANRGNPLFIQDRPGLQEQRIRIIKFKSMLDLRDMNGVLLPDNERMTSFGRWVRKLSIDELPQLINVWKGDMSLVGPRPLLFKYLPLYSDEQKRRHDVKPGITGWAQVNGRNSISWTDRFKYDVFYVDNVSFAMDLRILILTINKVLRREGINQSSERPMQPFNGTN